MIRRAIDNVCTFPPPLIRCTALQGSDVTTMDETSLANHRVLGPVTWVPFVFSSEQLI